MPYTMDNMPEAMKGAPQHAMEIFIAAFNTAFEKNHVEGAAMAIAMSAVHKAGYKKDDKGEWVDIRNPKPVVSEAEPSEFRNPNSAIQNNTEWIPIFRTGTHTDSAGNEKTWTEAELDLIVQKYQPQEHEAPVVIGHPEHNSPAWGWVEALKREGGYLYGKLKDLVPEFVDMVRKGFFKKRSISLYPDMTLRHVGFLGAMPPAVKGIPDVAFGDDKESINIEFGGFGTVNPRSEIQNPKSFGKEAKRMKWFEWLKGKATAEGVTIEDAPQSFADGGNSKSQIPNPELIKTLVDAEVKKIVEQKNAEFAEVNKKEVERLRGLDAELKKKEEGLEKVEGERLKAEIASFCEGLCKEGKLTPAMMKYGMGMQNYLESISELKTTIEYSEGDTKKTQSPYGYMKGFLGSFKKQIEFGEFAGADKDIPKGNDKRDAAIRDYQEKNRDKDGTQASYKDAVLAVSKEHPELFKE